MAKKSKTAAPKTTRASAKQLLSEYKERALQFISDLRYPKTVNSLSITGYELKEGRKLSKSVPVPELITMVGMAAQFGKKVAVTVTGSGDDVKLNFLIQDEAPSTPNDLLLY
jgi:hypothetical protein